MKALPTLVSVLIIGAVSAVVVTQRLKLTSTGYEIGLLEQEERRLQEEKRRLDNELSSIESRESIERLVVQHGIPLVPPESAGKTGKN